MGGSADAITLRMVQIASANMSDASLRIEGNTLDASGALCDGDQCTASDNITLTISSPKLEATIVTFVSTSFNFRRSDISNNTVRWFGGAPVC